MHAPHDVRPGDRLVADVYEALRQNAQLWAKTMFILTFDEHGGFNDHVIPPAVDNPDGVVGQKSSRAPAFGFDRLGLRVPAIIASPWVAKGEIAHNGSSSPKNPELIVAWAVPACAGRRGRPSLEF